MLSLSKRAALSFAVLLAFNFDWTFSRVLLIDEYQFESSNNYNQQIDDSDNVSDTLSAHDHTKGWIDYNKIMLDNNGDDIDFKTSFIIRFKNGRRSLKKAKAMCSKSLEEFQAEAEELEIGSECYLGFACDYVFETAFFGMSGTFELRELKQFVSNCFQDEVDYIEADRKVFKTQGGQGQEQGVNPSSPSPVVYVSPQSEKFETIMNRIDTTYREHVRAYYVRKHKNKTSALLDQIGDKTASFLNEFDVMFSQVEDSGEPLIRAMSAGEEGQAQGYESPIGLKSQDVVPGLWNLDRIDQDQLPLDGKYKFGAENHVGTGRGVTVYVLDSGIRQTHVEFMDMAMTRSRARIGADFIEGDGEGDDCDGHGTHVASTAVGRAVGIAKEAEVVGVRVLDCFGEGSVSNVLKALDWVAKDKKGPAVVVLSLGVESGTWSLSLEEEISTLIQEHNVTVTVASGNTGSDSCSISPANVATTITVAASNLPSKFTQQNLTENTQEDIYDYSNTGACVDIFAPGVDIYGACGGQNKCGFVHDQAYAWDDGTSMAVPHVAGAAAILLGEFPQATPALIKKVLVGSSTANKISDSLLLPDTPNRLLHIDIKEMAELYNSFISSSSNT
eukprot:TRINITY_DN341_c0_g3_i7.p1 TRINITY_DN341_c0_g3~~TRINITY_DN341_c0_g3_i7.p1  ORF type:complete len:616 (+),score=103.40 TRINITY_DN341_c0_g3_i7:730-2577(+)